MYLSTPSMMLIIQNSPNHKEVAEILGELKSRGDVFSHDAILNLITNSTKPNEVRRAAVVCAATLNGDKAIQWLRERAESGFVAPHQRKLALQGLMWCNSPAQTLHVLEVIAVRNGVPDVRIAAIGHIAVLRNVRSVGLLFLLSRDRDRAISDAAQRGLDALIKSKGGLTSIIESLKERAEYLSKQGNSKAALEVLRTASQLSPADGSVLSRIARLRAA